jgi:hypothetical protein
MNTDSFKIHSAIIENHVKSLDDIDKLHLFIVAQKYLWNHRGFFSVDDMVNVFRDKLGYESLKEKSNIPEFKNKIYNKLYASPEFFKHIDKEVFTIISDKKILNKLNTSKGKNNYRFFPNKFLTKEGKKSFRDVVIGMFALNHDGYSNAQIASQFKLTKMRVQLATKRNHKENIIKKNFRFVEISCKNKKEALELRKKLWDVRIRTIIKEKKTGIKICCFRTNSYDGSNLRSHKMLSEKVEQNKKEFVQKRYSEIMKNGVFFKKLGFNKILLTYLNHENRYFKFKNESWTLQNYINEYATF